MKKEAYEYKKIEDLTLYEFFSIGPKGRIQQMIQLGMVQKVPLIFNLELGPILSDNKIDTLSVTNNKDTKKILQSVTESILEFLNGRQEALVLIQGSTPARTRLFQMWIRGIHDQYREDISIEGWFRNRWYEFQKDMQFEAFLIKKIKY